MKKVILAILSSAFFPFIVFAVQGTCSSHGGVNCVIGSDNDGSAICNDGWTGSSEAYSSAIICGSYKPPCFYSDLQALRTKYDVAGYFFELDTILKKIDALELQQDALEGEKNQALINSGVKPEDTDMVFIRGEQANIQNEYTIKQNTISGQIMVLVNSLSMKQGLLREVINHINLECQTLGVEKQYQTQIDKTTQQNNIISLLAPRTVTCPANSTLLSDNSCKCNDGYSPSGTICITADLWCQNNTGGNSHSINNRCYCNSGYQYSESEKKCIKIQVQPYEPLPQAQQSEKKTEENKIVNSTTPPENIIPSSQIELDESPKQEITKAEDNKQTIQPANNGNAENKNEKAGFFRSVANVFKNFWKSIFK